MKIYLAFTVVGNREKFELVSNMAMLLQQRGHKILTTHLLSKTARLDESMKSPEFVFERDMKWLEECDAII
ncbi:MAG: hypothetical protein WC613_03930, partial [Candidatus Aenigmatarchaeota archaeon]